MTPEHFIREERSGRDALTILAEGQIPVVVGEGPASFATYQLKGEKLVGVQMINGCEVAVVGFQDTLNQRFQQLRETKAISSPFFK